MAKSLIDRLQYLGLSKKQAEIYLLLVRHKELRVNEIVERSNAPRSSVYETLRELLHKELIEEIVDDSFKRYRPYPITSLEHRFNEQIMQLQQQTESLPAIARAVEKQIGQTNTNVSKIRYYQGRSGAQQIFWNTLKAKNMLYVYSEWGRGKYLGIGFYKKFVEESKIRDIQEKVITNSTSHALNSIREHIGTPVSRTQLETIRMVPIDKIKFKGDSLMYDNIFAQVYLKDGEIHGFEIENPDFIKFQQQLFEQLWQNATPVSEFL